MTSQPPRVRKSWDLILTIVLLVLFAGWVIVCAFAGALLALTGDSCGSGAVCNDDQIGAAVYLGTLGPVVVGLVVFAVTISRLVRRRVAFFVPLVGDVLVLAVVATAFVVASNAVAPVS